MLKLIKLENNLKTRVTLCSYGASIYDIETLDKNGNLESIVVVPNDEEIFKFNDGYYGKTIGRTSGRIKDSKYTLNGIEYTIPTKDPNGLHGGDDSIAFKDFDYKIIESEASTTVEFIYHSKDMESGFPGNAEIKIAYVLHKNENKLEAIYEAVSDKDTLMNITNHSYFNLSGNNKRDVLNHNLYINSSKMVKLDNMIPCCIAECGDKYSFKTPHKIKDFIFDSEIKVSANGYDFPYIFDEENVNLDNVKLTDEESGRNLTIATTYPAVVVYTCNYPGDTVVNSNQKPLVIHGAICLECQYLPNAINSDFIEDKKEILRKNEKYFNKIIYKFN